MHEQYEKFLYPLPSPRENCLTITKQTQKIELNLNPPEKSQPLVRNINPHPHKKIPSYLKISHPHEIFSTP